MPTGALFGWLHGRKSRLRHCAECDTAWTIPPQRGSTRPGDKGVPIGELYAASRLLSNQSVARAKENAEVHEAFAHCPRCGSGNYTESRERR